MPETPEHRTGFATRNGDTHVIGADGAIVNTDQALRDAAAAAPQGERVEVAARQSEAERKPRSNGVGSAKAD